MTSSRYRVSPLPSPDQRMTPNRKARIVDGVAARELPIEAALERYGLTAEEFHTWQRKLDRHGVQGLRQTRAQQYRGTSV